MKLLSAITLLTFASATVASPKVALHSRDDSLVDLAADAARVARRAPEAIPFFESRDHASSYAPHELHKRKGGGGGGGRTGSSGSGSGSSSSSGSSGSSSGSSSSGSSSSGSGGRSSSGSGVTPSYGGSYAGGARTPYRAGLNTPSGLPGYFIGGAALGFLPFALVGAGAYLYPWSHPISYYNRTSNQNVTAPVDCVCAQNSDCGCDENSNSTYIDALIGNGSAAALSANNVTRASNGTLYIDGTLPNGTTSDDDVSAASATKGTAGWLALSAAVACAVVLVS